MNENQLRENLLLYIKDLEGRQLYFKEMHLAAQKLNKELDNEFYLGKFFMVTAILLDLKAMIK